MFEIDLKKYHPARQLDSTYLCHIRKRPISITPEETVRQALIHFLVTEKGYPWYSIKIEVPMAHFVDGEKGRADLLIMGDDEEVLCLIECKEPNEVLSDQVIEQLNRYDNVVIAKTSCIVIGNVFYFFVFDENEERVKISKDFPTYLSLKNDAKFDCFDDEATSFERFPIAVPFAEEDLEFFFEDGIIGKDTNSMYFPILFNLYNFCVDENDTVNHLHGIDDLGLKTIKYGNASGGRFFGNYRAFHVKDINKVVTLSISSMTRDEGYPVYTSLMLGVEEKGKFHLSLELRVDKFVTLHDHHAVIVHDRTITIGNWALRNETI